MFTLQRYILFCMLSKGKTRKDAGEIPKVKSVMIKTVFIENKFSFPSVNRIFALSLQIKM